jgi:hypothetical protein
LSRDDRFLSERTDLMFHSLRDGGMPMRLSQTALLPALALAVECVRFTPPAKAD